jgi:hypothetical protein
MCTAAVVLDHGRLTAPPPPPHTHTPPQLASKDKDFRYMATSDLLQELSKDTFQVDPELEKRLCAAVATQLEDQSADISGIAVKWCVLLRVVLCCVVVVLCVQAGGRHTRQQPQQPRWQQAPTECSSCATPGTAPARAVVRAVVHHQHRTAASLVQHPHTQTAWASWCGAWASRAR